jgi:DNA-binding response OmpR family regulator
MYRGAAMQRAVRAVVRREPGRSGIEQMKAPQRHSLTWQPPVTTVAADLHLDEQDAELVAHIAQSGAPALLTWNGRQVSVMLALAAEPRKLYTSGLCLDWTWHSLSYGGRTVSLPPGEARLAAALLEAAPRTVSRAVLASRLWPTSHAERGRHDKTLSVWICSIRRRLSALAFGGDVEAIRGVGYRLVGPSALQRLRDCGLTVGASGRE